jgi:WD40 repeat protein
MKAISCLTLRIMAVILLAGLTAGCQKEGDIKPGSVTPQAVSTPVAPALPLPAAIAPASQNHAALPDWNLELITAANVQRLGLLAHFGEGGLQDELALSPDGKVLAVAASGGVVLYDALTAEWLNYFPTGSNVTGLVFSPDGRKLAYFSRIPGGEKYSPADPDFQGQEILKPQLTLWSILDGKELFSLPTFGRGCGDYAAWDLTFSPDGKRILFQDNFGWTGLPRAGALCVLDAGNGSLLRVITPEKPWRVSAFTPLLSDGKTLWLLCVDDSKAVETGSIPKQLRRYNLESGVLEAQVDLPESGNLRLSPDSQWLVVGSTVAQIRSAVDGSLAAEIKTTEGESQFSAASFSPDGGTLALGAWDGSVNLYRVPQGQPVGRIEPVTIPTTLAREGGPLHVVDLHFSSDGSILYILLNSYFVDTPEVMRAVRLSDGQELFRLSGRNTVNRYPSLSPDHALLAWGGYEDGSIQVWSTASRTMSYTLKGHTRVVLQTLFSPDGRQLATASMDGTVRLWNTADGAPQATLEGHKGGVWAIGYSTDGSRLASVGMDGLLKLWNPVDGSLLKTIETGTDAWQVNSVRFTEDNHSALVVSGCIYPLNCLAGGAGDLRRIDLESGQISTLLTKGIVDLSFSADQSFFGMFGAEGAQFGRVSSGQFQIQHSFTSPYGNGGVYGAALSPDGNLFFSGNSFGIHGWDAKSGQMIALAQDRSQAGNYGSMQITGDGRILLVSGNDGVIYLWGVVSK